MNNLQSSNILDHKEQELQRLLTSHHNWIFGNNAVIEAIHSVVQEIQAIRDNEGNVQTEYQRLDCIKDY